MTQILKSGSTRLEVPVIILRGYNVSRLAQHQAAKRVINDSACMHFSVNLLDIPINIRRGQLGMSYNELTVV